MSALLQAANHASIEVGGVPRPLFNSEGTPLADSLEAAEAFWRRFKDSAMVDSQGRPIVFYHGTAAVFDQFSPSPSAFYGAGVYFCDDRDAAAEFGDDANETDNPSRVVAVYLGIRNPFVFNAPAADREPTNITLARTLLGETPKFTELITRLSKDWNQPGHEFQNRLRAMGHDGLVVRVPGEPAEYVAFDPTQIMVTADAFRLSPPDAATAPVRRSIKMR